MAFRVGQRIVCIERNFPSDCDPEALLDPEPDYNEICVITNIIFEDDGDHYLELSGYQGLEFLSSCFRPLITLEDDVKLFQRISEDTFGRLEVLEQALNESY